MVTNFYSREDIILQRYFSGAQNKLKEGYDLLGAHVHFLQNREQDQLVECVVQHQIEEEEEEEKEG